MKKLTYIALASGVVAICAMGLSTYLYFSQSTVAYVNNQSVLLEYNGVKEGKKLLDEKVEKWQANLDSLEKEIDGLIVRYQQRYMEMSGKEREINENLIKARQQKYFEYKEAMDENTTSEDARLTEAILKRINSYLTEYGEEHAYDLIIGVTDAGNVLYAEEAMDITEDVIAGLNQNYEGE